MLWMLIALSVLRLLFAFLNRGAFQMASTLDYLQSFAAGIYFDFIYTFYALLPIGLLLIFGSYLFRYKWLRWFESVYFLAIMLVTTVLACIDMAYYPFVKTHIGADLIFFMSGENNISVWTYIFNYWYLLIVCLAIPPLTWKLSGALSSAHKGYKIVGVLPRLGLLLLLAFVVRGGTRLRPITSLDAVLFAPSNMENLVANPEFIFVESLNATDELFYDPELDITSIEESNVKYFGEKDSLRRRKKKPNIVLIILESFGKEFTGLNEAGKPSYTPFLDSLMRSSYNCENAYANGQKSKDAIPAIFTGIPALIDNGFLLSKYSKNELPSLPKMLGEMGYTSLFFHGANNGSMGFRNYLYSHGLDEYYGIEEYPKSQKEKDFDGHWGIFDKPYLHYFADMLDKKEEPFFATVFTLSSHDPYAIPDEYADQIPDGRIKLHKSVGYADMALQSFFERMQNTKWAENTMFIITADHSSLNSVYRYQAGAGKYEVPLLIYSPKIEFPSRISKPVQHLDLLPTILDIVQYPDTVTVLGESMIDWPRDTSALIFRDGNAYLYQKSNWEIKVVNDRVVHLSQLEWDPGRETNFLKQYPHVAEELLLEMQRIRSNIGKKLIYNHF